MLTNLINFQEGFFYCDNVLLMMTSDVIPQSRCSKAEYAHTCADDHLCLLNCRIYIYIYIYIYILHFLLSPGIIKTVLKYKHYHNELCFLKEQPLCVSDFNIQP